MKTIVVASQKGGVGKTTLAAHLAVEASEGGRLRCGLMDTDPQGSLAAWWNSRAAEEPVFVAGDLDRLAAQAGDLAAAGLDFLFVDTPPALSASIVQVSALADMILVPVRPSPHDLRAVSGTVDLLEPLGKPMIFVINSATRRARITGEAAIALSQHGTVAPVMVHHRVDFASSMVDGRTVGELDASAPSSEEIRELWKYVNARLRK